VRLRLDDAIRTAREILDTDGSSYIVLWRGDENDEDDNKEAINLSELQLIELVGGGGQASLLCCTVPSPGTDTTHERDEDLRDLVLNSDDKVVRTWAQGVSNLSIELDEETPAEARLVTWRFKLADRELAEQMVGSVARRPSGSASQEES
jgi:hypothetical protein